MNLKIKENIIYKVRNDLAFPTDKQSMYDNIFIEVNLPNQPTLIIGNIYRSPGSQNIHNFTNDIENILNKIKQEKHNVIISGDFNINLLNTNTHKPTTEFLDTWLSNGYMPHLTLPTRVTYSSATLIDNIFTKSIKTNFITSKGILTTDISDHYPSFIEIQSSKQ